MAIPRIIQQLISGTGFPSISKLSKVSSTRWVEQAKDAAIANHTLLLAKLVGWQYSIAEDCLHYTPGIMDWLFANPTGKASQEELISSTTTAQQESLQRKISHAINGGTGFEAEIKKKTPEGKEKWVRVSCQIEKSDGSVSKLVGTIQDITFQKKKELRCLQQQLIAPYKLLQRSQWQHENELGRIAVEVHENISQVLIVARNYLQVDLIETTPRNGKNERGIKIIEKAIHQLQDLYEKIDIPPLMLLGLEGALTELIERYNRQMPTQILLTSYDDTLEQADELTKLTLIRLIKELLSNIKIHAQATEAWVYLEKKEEEILCMVKDDGIGFYPDKDHWRSGLRRIEITCGMLGGDLLVNSSPGKGCDVMVTLPYSSGRKYIH